MADWLLLRLPRASGEPASWLVADARGAPAGPPQDGPLTLAAPRAAGRRVCVLVPGADVLLAEPDVPVKAGAMLHPGGIEPEAIYADSELLPHNPGQAVVLLEEDAVFVRSPGASPVTLPADALAEALEIAQSGADGAATGARGLILYTGAAEWQRHSAQIEAARAHFDGIKIQLLTGGPLALFAQQLPAVTPINLLQGAYAPTAARAVGLRAWRVAAILLVSLIGLHLAGKLGELQLLKNREHQVDASIRDTFHTAMPGDPNTLDARRRMEQRLNAARGAGGGLLP